jgi:hypothetical protein
MVYDIMGSFFGLPVVRQINDLLPFPVFSSLSFDDDEEKKEMSRADEQRWMIIDA